MTPSPIWGRGLDTCTHACRRSSCCQWEARRRISTSRWTSIKTTPAQSLIGILINPAYIIPTYPPGPRGPPVSRNFQVSYDCWDENTPYLPGANYASLSGASTLQCSTVLRALVRIVTNKKNCQTPKRNSIRGSRELRPKPYMSLCTPIYIPMYLGGFWRLLKRITRLAFKDPVPMVQPTLQAHLMSGLRV